MLATVRPHGVDRSYRKTASYDGDRVKTSVANPMSSEGIKTTIVRVPKLAVRSKDASTDLTRTTSTAATAASSCNSLKPPLSTRSSGSSTTSSRRPSEQLSRQSTGESNGSTNVTATNKKKKSGVFGFLTLKEPSTSAWEEYAAQQKKAAEAKGARVTAVGIPGVSTQKLPGGVPKVNSKWDGLPDEARRKLDEAKQQDKSRRMSNLSSMSRSTQRSGPSSSDGGRSTRHAFGSISSRPQSLSSPRPPRTSTQTKYPVELSTLPEVVPFQQHSAVHDPEDPIPVYPPHAPESGTFLHPPSPPTAYRELPGTAAYHELQAAGAYHELPAGHAPHELPTARAYHELATKRASDIPDLPELAGHVVTSPEGSPITPSLSELIPQDSKDTTETQVFALDSNGTLWYSDTDTEDVIVKSAGRGVLQPPSVVRWRPRAEAPMEHIEETETESSDAEQPNWPLPATRQSSRVKPVVVGEPSFERATPEPWRPFSPSSPYTTTTRTKPLSDSGTDTSTAASPTATYNSPEFTTLRSNSNASVAPSLAPSIMSAQWRMTPKERLGLGGKVVRKAEVLPWELAEAPNEADECSNAPTKNRHRISSMLGRR